MVSREIRASAFKQRIATAGIVAGRKTTSAKRFLVTKVRKLPNAIGEKGRLARRIASLLKNRFRLRNAAKQVSNPFSESDLRKVDAAPIRPGGIAALAIFPCRTFFRR